MTLIAVWVRWHNAFHYPPDWGFDASFNLRYILRMSEDWAIPSPEVGWSTSDPPLFFTLGAVLWSLFDRNLFAVPLMNSVFGLAIAALAAMLVRRIDPERPARALLAGALMLFLPANIQMSVMVNEEILVSLLASATLFVLVVRTSEHPVRGAAAAGMASGLATLTKLGGVLAAATAALTYAIDGLHGRTLRRAAQQIGIVLIVAGLVGGWFYARNRIVYGYFQPQNLAIHERMFDIPPGERGILDFVYVPIATFSDPQMLNPDLLHSVWGGTYATAWFDAHRFFLPRDHPGVTRLGTVTLLLALLPTLAFAIGAGRGLRRTQLDPTGCDTPLLIFGALTLVGYAYFAHQNPFFVVIKGTSLLALSLPFAVYASEVLTGWMDRGRAAALAIGTLLAALALCAVLGSTFNVAFEKSMDEVSGLPWQTSGDSR